MKKSNKMLAIALGLAVTLGTVSASPMSAEAASQYNGNYFEQTLDSYDSSIMEKADGWTNGDMFNCTWRGTNVTFHDGIMDLKIDKDQNGQGYSGGEYRTRQTFGYGMYEVEMKPIKNDGVVSSFFTYTGPTDGTAWDEIDIEFLGKDTTKVQFNYFTNSQGNHEFLYDLGFDASQSFHKYGFYWAKDSITWYVDGKAVYKATSNIPSTPGKIMMNVWNGTGVDSWLNHYNGRTPLIAQYDKFSFTPAGASTPVNPTPVNPTSVYPTPVNPTPVTPTPAPASGSLNAVYSINNWGSGYQVSIKIENKSGSKVDTWTLTIPKSEINIATFWNVNVKEVGSNYVITPVSWNSSIANGGSVEFGIIGTGSIGNKISCTIK